MPWLRSQAHDTSAEPIAPALAAGAGDDFGGHWVIALLMVFGDSSAIADSAIATLPHGLWSSVWFATTHDHMAAFPNTLTMIVLASNFGTFMLYMLSCIICIIAYQKHLNFSAAKHLFVPIFGVLVNVVCMASYLIGPFMGYGTKREPFGALAIAALWGKNLPQQPHRAVFLAFG